MKTILFGLCLLLVIPTSAQMHFTPVTAGDYLLKARRQHFTGLGITAGGILLASAVSFTDSDNSSAAIGIGGTFMLIGVIFECRAWSSIGKAGELMNKNNLSLSSSPGGVGISWRFSQNKRFNYPS